MVVSRAFLECEELLILKNEKGGDLDYFRLNWGEEKNYRGKGGVFTLPLVSGSTSHMIGDDRRGWAELGGAGRR